MLFRSRLESGARATLLLLLILLIRLILLPMVTILVMVVLLMMPAMMDFVLLIEIRFFGGLPVARFGQIHVVIFQLLRKGASLLSRELVIFCGLFHVRSVDAQLVLEEGVFLFGNALATVETLQLPLFIAYLPTKDADRFRNVIHYRPRIPLAALVISGASVPLRKHGSRSHRERTNGRKNKMLHKFPLGKPRPQQRKARAATPYTFRIRLQNPGRNCGPEDTPRGKY